MMDAMDDALLGADDDELDYDLEKDEEDALLADDNYEDVYDEIHTEENQEQQYEEQPPNEEESDVLDIDSNVRLDEAEDDFGDQSLKDNVQQENDDEEEVEEQKERNRFLNERKLTVQRTNTNEIPDTLEKVAVQPMPQQHNNRNNGRYQRGNRGRGRGRQNYRGSVFGRVGNMQPPPEGKTVLINPHFRGNVQVSENARLVWDSNVQNNNNMPPQQRFPGPQTAQVAPFQNHISPWINQQFSEQNNFNQPQYQEPPMQYQPPDIVAIRPLLQVTNQPPPFVPHQQLPQQQMTNWCDDQSYCETMYPSQGNFRGRDIRFQNQAAIPPLMMNNPPPNFNRNNFNYPEPQNRPFVNPHHQNASTIMQVQPNYPPPHQTFEQPPQHFIQQNQYNQNRHIQPVYDQYNDHNQHQNAQFPSPMINNTQNFNGPNFQQPNYEPNFIPNQPPPESFPPKQYNHPYHQNRPNNQHQRNHHQMNQYNNRSPPKRRSFENTTVSGDRDLPKKKKRSMELSNLHEVPTVDMPDTTTEEREEEDEETKEYRLKIEEQKKLREKILRQKEERRKLAAAQKADDLETTPTAPVRNVVPTQVTKPPIQQKRLQQQQQPSTQQVQKVVNRNQQQQRQRQMLQKKQMQNQRLQNTQMQNNQRPQNIQVQTNAAGQRPNQGRMIQQRRHQPVNQANIVITKNEPTTRRVVLKGTNTINTSTNTSEQNNQVTQDNGNLSSFLSNRKVITNSFVSATPNITLNQTALLETPIVVVSNLAAGTSEVKIRKLCQGLGPIQNIQMIPNQRQATIRFKNIVSAQKFFKKYQRKIVDLSMIQVKLEPES